MKRILILGGGYAGLTAARHLTRIAKHQATVELIDRRNTHHALPILPDIIGRDFPPTALQYSLEHAAHRFEFEFRQEEIKFVDPQRLCVETDRGLDSADAMIVATGTQSDFHGMTDLTPHAITLDNVGDAKRIRRKITDNERTIVITGGGYTGVELATAIRRHDRIHQISRRVILVEINDTLCPGVPEPFQTYTTENVKNMGIEIRTETKVNEASSKHVSLSDGEQIDHALLLWTAGVSTPGFVRTLNHPKNKQGRLEVDEYLQIAPNCFAAGDSASVKHNSQELRMSIQFAISEGKCAAENVERALQGNSLKAFKPFDPGYLIPMANNRACGIVLGKSVYGRTAIALHYFMCTFRSVGLSNQWHIATSSLSSLIRGKR